jgi:hypothetical protein
VVLTGWHRGQPERAGTRAVGEGSLSRCRLTCRTPGQARGTRNRWNGQIASCTRPDKSPTKKKVRVGVSLVRLPTMTTTNLAFDLEAVPQMDRQLPDIAESKLVGRILVEQEEFHPRVLHECDGWQCMDRCALAGLHKRDVDTLFSEQKSVRKTKSSRVFQISDGRHLEDDFDHVGRTCQSGFPQSQKRSQPDFVGSSSPEIT